MARSFIQPRHGTPFVTILSIAVEQETDSETATRPPFASPRIGPIDSSRSRENRLPPSPLPPLPPIPINPFPRIDDHTYIYIYIHSIQGPRVYSTETFDPASIDRGVVSFDRGIGEKSGIRFCNEFLMALMARAARAGVAVNPATWRI